MTRPRYTQNVLREHNDGFWPCYLCDFDRPVRILDGPLDSAAKLIAHAEHAHRDWRWEWEHWREFPTLKFTWIGAA